MAAEALRKLHNEGFNEGVLAGLKSLAESCRARREKQVPNALGNRRAAFGASVLTDVLCGNGTEVGAGGTAKG